MKCSAGKNIMLISKCDVQMIILSFCICYLQGDRPNRLYFAFAEAVGQPSAKQHQFYISNSGKCKLFSFTGEDGRMLRVGKKLRHCWIWSDEY